MTPPELRVAVDEIAVEPVDGAFLWQDVAQLALHRWTPRHLASAVGNDLPYLNQTRSIRVELPIYQIRYLHHRSLSAGTPVRNASDSLEDLIFTALGDEEFTELELAIPGFTNAINFPYLERWQARMLPECIYCGTSPISDEICSVCKDIHEPEPSRDGE